MNIIAKKSVKVGNYVSKREVNELTSAYKQERWAANSERLGKADSLILTSPKKTSPGKVGSA